MHMLWKCLIQMTMRQKRLLSMRWRSCLLPRMGGGGKHFFEEKKCLEADCWSPKKSFHMFSLGFWIWISWRSTSASMSCRYWRKTPAWMDMRWATPSWRSSCLGTCVEMENETPASSCEVHLGLEDRWNPQLVLVHTCYCLNLMKLWSTLLQSLNVTFDLCTFIHFRGCRKTTFFWVSTLMFFASPRTQTHRFFGEHLWPWCFR